MWHYHRNKFVFSNEPFMIFSPNDTLDIGFPVRRTLLSNEMIKIERIFFVATPHRGSAYRCLQTKHWKDPVLRSIAERSSLPLHRYLPTIFTMWIGKNHTWFLLGSVEHKVLNSRSFDYVSKSTHVCWSLSNKTRKKSNHLVEYRIFTKSNILLLMIQSSRDWDTIF